MRVNNTLINFCEFRILRSGGPVIVVRFRDDDNCRAYVAVFNCECEKYSVLYHQSRAWYRGRVALCHANERVPFLETVLSELPSRSVVCGCTTRRPRGCRSAVRNRQGSIIGERQLRQLCNSNWPVVFWYLVSVISVCSIC